MITSKIGQMLASNHIISATQVFKNLTSYVQQIIPSTSGTNFVGITQKKINGASINEHETISNKI